MAQLMSKVKGVCQRGNKWEVSIMSDGKRIYLGLFANFEDAVAVRKWAEVNYASQFKYETADGTTDPDRIKQALDYNPETGVFTWKMKTSNCIIIGNEAGGVGKKGYHRIRVFGVHWLSHRLAFLIMEGRVPDTIDHINGIPSDNRWCNLRAVTQQENCKNQKRRNTNKSGAQGVCRCSRDNELWRANIMVDGKQIYLGRFTNFEDAVKARKQAEVQHGFHPNHGR
jgi:hypothetical protein